MKRSQLLTLKHSNLQYYMKHNHIQVSLNSTTEDLIEVILSRQAKALVEKANDAIRELKNVPPGTDMTNIDMSSLNYHSTAYSNPGAGGGRRSGGNERGSDRVDGATPTEEGLHIRKKVKKVLDGRLDCKPLYFILGLVLIHLCIQN